MPYCPLCGYNVTEMDIICPNCKYKFQDNFLQTSPKQDNPLSSNDEDFLKIDERDSTQFQNQYHQNFQNQIPPNYNYEYPAQYPVEYPEQEYKKSKAGIGLKIIGFFVALILLFAIFQTGFLDDYLDFSTTPYTEVPESVEFTVKRSMTISNNRGSARYNLRIPKPNSIEVDDKRNNVYLQEIESVKVISTDDYINDDNWFIWDNNIRSDNNHNIEITYKIKANTYQWDINSDNSGKVSDIPSTYTKKYSSTEDEWLIETSNPAIKSLALQLTKDKSNVYEKVKAIYQYLRKNVDYVVHSEPQPCTTTLNTMRGDCDDQSILFCALSRSIGIPAWLEYGFIYDKTRQQWGGHGWATVCIPKDNGYIATPHIDIVNQKFLWEDCYRITEWIDDGNPENLENYYNYFESSSSGGTPATITESHFNTIDLKTSGNIRIPVEV